MLHIRKNERLPVNSATKPTNRRVFVMRAYFPALFLLVPVAIAAACGGSSSQPSNNGGASGDAPTVRFALAGDTVPSFLDVPFPSDVYLANGKVIDPLPGVDAVFKT